MTLQAQILQLLADLQSKTGMAMLFITHDLSVIKDVADRVAVMYAGHIIEEASSEQFFTQSLHPYSHCLLKALPSLQRRQDKLTNIVGEVAKLAPEVLNKCRFLSRCPQVEPSCHEELPAWQSIQDGHAVRCLLAKDQWLVTQHKKQPLHEAFLQIRNKQPILLHVKDLQVHFPKKNSLLKRKNNSHRVVDGVSFHLRQGETLALVGESGCGKTTIARALVGLLPIKAGDVNYGEQNLARCRARHWAALRRDIQLIFQDPYSAMNPRMMVGDIVTEGLRAQQQMISDTEIIALLSQVGLARDSLHRYPHEFSGGQRQRICIARALALSPKLLILDEPTSALDVSVQAQVLNLLRDLQQERQLSYLFITHDMSVVAYMANRIAVMYQGKIVEQGSVGQILQKPTQAYTRELLDAVPELPNIN